MWWGLGRPRARLYDATNRHDIRTAMPITVMAWRSGARVRARAASGGSNNSIPIRYSRAYDRQSMSPFILCQVDPGATRPLRQSVLRPHEATEALAIHEPPGTFALGAFE